MQNTRSTNREKSVNTFHYAVHPIAAQFDKQYTHNYYLYLEKNQQILGRYELSPKTIQKSNKYYFQSPTAIQYFRIISESNLEFKWSLYMQKISDSYRQEEYMEGKKANLKWCWQSYNQHQESVNWVQVIFGVVKLKFYYLFVVGQTHQSILQSIQDYYRKNSIKPSKLLQINQNFQPLESDLMKTYSLQKIAQLSYKISETFPILLQSQSAVEQAKSVDPQNSKQTTAKIISNDNSYMDRAFQSNQVNSFIQGQATPSKQVTPNMSKSPGHLKLKLTVSELQISKDIQKHIKQSIQQPSKLTEEANIKFQSRKETYHPIVNLNSLVRTKHITSSQYLNERNQMVVSPFYTHIKYWIIIIAILIIFGTLVHLGPKKRQVKDHHNQPSHSHQQKHIMHKNKKTKTKKRQANKKKQSKSAKQKRKSKKKVLKKSQQTRT